MFSAHCYGRERLALYTKCEDTCVLVECVLSNDGTRTGSGVFYTPDAAYVLTSWQVVADAVRRAVVHKGVRFEAVVEGRNEAIDVAVLRLSGFNAPPPYLPALGTAVAGMAVYALGYSDTVAHHVLKINRGSVASPVSVSQLGIVVADTDNGFSGGPCVDVHGRIVGIIKGGIGTSRCIINIVPAFVIHGFLLCAGLPGLRD